MKKMFTILALVLAVILFIVPVTFASANDGPTFVDVPEDHFFYTEIEGIFDAGITTGWVIDEEEDIREFRPNLEITRMAMAAFLVRGLDLEDEYDVPDEPTFDDVPVDHFFFEEIEILHASGITEGWEDEENDTLEFRPNRNVTRMAMAAFLDRGLELDEEYDVPEEPTFTDVSEDHPFFDNIERLAASGISTGWDVNGEFEFRPNRDITRMAMAAFLYRALVDVDLEVVSVDAVTDTVEVPFGTSEEDAIAALEADTEYLVTFDDDSTTTLAGTDWEAVDEYASTTAATYEFTGQLELPENNYCWGDATSTVAGFVEVLPEAIPEAFSLAVDYGSFNVEITDIKGPEGADIEWADISDKIDFDASSIIFADADDLGDAEATTTISFADFGFGEATSTASVTLEDLDDEGVCLDGDDNYVFGKMVFVEEDWDDVTSEEVNLEEIIGLMTPELFEVYGVDQGNESTTTAVIATLTVPIKEKEGDVSNLFTVLDGDDVVATSTAVTAQALDDDDYGIGALLIEFDEPPINVADDLMLVYAPDDDNYIAGYVCLNLAEGEKGIEGVLQPQPPQPDMAPSTTSPIPWLHE